VTPLMAAQLGRAVDELDQQIAAARAAQWGAPMSMAA
jgi:hypothetical protein